MSIVASRPSQLLQSSCTTVAQKWFALCYRTVCPVLSVLSVTLVYSGQTVGRIKMKLGTQVSHGPGHIVLDGDPALPPQRFTALHQFPAYVRFGQTAGWIKMSLGRKAGDFVLDGDPAPLPKRGQNPPQFSAHVYCGQMAGWIMMALGMEVGLGPGHLVLHGDPAPPPKNGAEAPNFRPISIEAKQLDASRCHMAWR